MDPLSIMTQFASGDRVQPDSPGVGFKLAIDPLPHQRYREAMSRVAELHLRRRIHGAGGGLLLTGPSGAGKSTMVRTYHGRFPREHLADRTVVPVLLVSVPASPTARSLAGAILEALGQRKAHRGTAPEKTSWIYELFAKCGVEMVILDEFQHLFYAPTLNAFRDITDWLKNFLEDTRVGMVACGLPAAEWVVNSNEQLARRFSERIRISPFSLEVGEDFQEFRGILKAFEVGLPLPTEVPLYESNLARRFHVGSYGLLDYVVKILEGGVSAATAAGLETLDLPVLAAGFRNRVWRDVPERLNPFHPESLLRPLDRPGEVFYLHTRQDPVGSPVARKLGMNLTRGGS
ncbi:TniB family NTP-binding protein [Rhodocyclus tenuis]|uniref:DNA transposition AAA+ family ATPase n=1 Tax=Rhodocyclus tenuis TaxID=1066 RepID=A0A840G3B6_RHOTE|nr:TniB family NTP-binding protein [Rhodocyclus tenuis]MBB4248897.1 DNA transposition AAA+ family ATPase [Rhodocyclus tenuis]